MKLPSSAWLAPPLFAMLAWKSFMQLKSQNIFHALTWAIFKADSYNTDKAFLRCILSFHEQSNVTTASICISISKLF